MRIKANKAKQASGLAEKKAEVEDKLDELITLFSENEFDSETLKQFKHRFNNAIEKKEFNPKQIEVFKVIDQKEDVSRDELLDEFSMLLNSTKIDSNISSKYIKGERTIKAVLMLVGVVMITLGFAMIIMPASHDFEMYTIFWFNPNDGVTLMDLISLVIILAGIYILVRAIYKKTITLN
ncbi:MAG: hypothetical protein JWR67_2874 [Mucilaginibacter sp.]|nr:hypothetical protein [Mucilaginibacter sp.]